ncbi:class I adenylate-forming enzyme family protein [Paenibacillus polymyxa]
MVRNQSKQLFTLLYERNFRNLNTFYSNLEFQISYSNFFESVDETMSTLKEKGIKEGDVVALQIPSSLSFIKLLFAIWGVGASVLIVDARMKDKEMGNLFDEIQPNIHIYAVGTNFLTFKHEFNVMFDTISDTNHNEWPPLILSTSGSTGKPKIIGRSFDSIKEELIRYTAPSISVKKDDVVMILSPITFSFGLMSGLLPSIFIGANIVLTSYKTREIVENIKIHNVSILYGVPYHFSLIESTINDNNVNFVKKIRMAISAGETLSNVTKEKFYEKFSVNIGQLYGMSEAGVIAVDFLGEDISSVGKPLLPIKLVDNEIMVKLQENPYLRGEGKGIFTECWLKTGDVGEMKEQSDLLFLKGRSDSLIIKGGMKYYLIDIENQIKTIDGVEEVLVMINPDQKITAYITKTQDGNNLNILSSCKVEIADYKLPNKLVFIPNFPRTLSGKIDKKSLFNISDAEIINL